MTEIETEKTRGKHTRPANRRDQILDVAEELARRGGYHGFSFRDVAARVGIKSASIHHHFPTKSDLVCTLVRRYANGFVGGRGTPDAADALPRLVRAYRRELRARDQMCLCGLLGAERDTLPEDVRKVVRQFYIRLRRWVEMAMGGEGNPGRRARAETLIAGLEGALIMARVIGNPKILDRVSGQLVSMART